VLIPAHTRAHENVKVSDDLITNEVRKWRTHDVPGNATRAVTVGPLPHTPIRQASIEHELIEHGDCGKKP